MQRWKCSSCVCNDIDAADDDDDLIQLFIYLRAELSS
jgi:hypothetical protein